MQKLNFTDSIKVFVDYENTAPNFKNQHRMRMVTLSQEGQFASCS